MQALELECRVPNLIGEHLDRGNRVRIVRGKLRVDGILGFQHLARAGQIVEVGPGLCGEDREVRIALDVGMLDFAVPVCALHEPHHETMACLLGEVFQPVDHITCALLVSLNSQPQPVPVPQRRFPREPIKNLQAEHQPVSFLRIKTEVDIGFRCAFT